MLVAFAYRAGVRDHVRKMGQYAFEDLGEQSVKNIAQPI